MNRNMMRQAQRQLAQLQKIQDELETLTVSGTAGGGVVKVVMTGKQAVESVEIHPEAAEDIELLQDMMVAAFNDAAVKAQELAASKMSVITGGMNIPGLTSIAHVPWIADVTCAQTGHCMLARLGALSRPLSSKGTGRRPEMLSDDARIEFTLRAVG